MRGLDFGGQTKIAYTQDPNLHCLEVTDLEKRGRYTTRRFFDGSKPEYPRAMRCIQGSDAHRLVRESPNSKYLGVGDRVTEILLPEVSFKALFDVLRGQDFSLTRPYRGPAKPLDFVLVAREEGPSIVQAFHKSMAERGGYFNRILEDICAMSNTNGGTIYIGLSANPKEKIVGVRNPKKAIDYLQNSINKRVTPEPIINIDTLVSQGATIVRIIVSPGRDIPYAIDDNRFYVRDESETTLAVRDEIVRLVERRFKSETSEFTIESSPSDLILESSEEVSQKPPQSPIGDTPTPPSTGVEIVESEERNGTIYHTVRDLRNGNLIKNVTESSARKLWHYAITQTESGNISPEDIDWFGNLAFLNERRKDNHIWFDLAMRDDKGIHIYYGVTDSGLNEDWMELVQKFTQ
jgi:hypothetical protein